MAVEAAVAHSEAAGWSALWSFSGPPIGATGRTRVSTLRRRYRAALMAVPAGWPVVYHQFAGLDILVGEDITRHRILWLHDSCEDWRVPLGWAARYADGFIFDREEWHAAAARQLDWIPARRRTTIDATALTPEGFRSADERLGRLLEVRIARNSRPRSGWWLPLAFYRRQLSWLP